MQLRDLPVWPPVWTRKDAAIEQTAIDSFFRGEVGILQDAAPDPIASAIVVTIEHEGQAWVGLLPFDAPARRLSVTVLLLRENRGRPIRDLAALPLPD